MNEPNENKGIFSVRINIYLVKPLKHLAIDLNKSLGNLLEEAIRDLLKKYESKAPTKKGKS